MQPDRPGVTDLEETAEDRAIDEDPGRPVPPFPFQLVDAYLMSSSLTRRESKPDDPDRPRFRTSIGTEDQPDLDGFLAHLQVDAVFTFRPGATCELSACTTGVFLRVEGADPEIEGQFRSSDCAVILWPYARATVAELARMAGLTDIPPLPTIDVRSSLASLRAEES
jgi:hypothetical protein